MTGTQTNKPTKICSYVKEDVEQEEKGNSRKQVNKHKKDIYIFIYKERKRERQRDISNARETERLGKSEKKRDKQKDTERGKHKDLQLEIKEI